MTRETDIPIVLSAGFHVDEALIVGDAVFREKCLESNGVTTLYVTYSMAGILHS